MTRTTIGLALAAILLALPAWAQSSYQTQAQRDAARARSTPSITAESLRDSYAAAAKQRESRATKLSAADYQELRRQRSQLDDAIRRIERGGNVGAGDVDRIIGNDSVN